MKKKLFGYLTLAFAIMGAGLAGSCNDYCEDLYDEYRLTAEREDSTLSQLIQQNIADIKELQTKFKTCQDSCKERWSRLSDSIKVLQDSATNGHNRIYTELASLQATDKMLGEAIDSVKNVLDTLGSCIGEGGDPKTALVYLFTTATEAKADAAAAMGAAMGKADRDSIAIENIKYMWSDSLSEVYSMAAAANALATRDSIFMYDLKEYIDSVDSTLLDSISAVAVIAKENLQKAKDYAHQQDSIMKEELLDSMDAKLADVYKAFQKADSLLQDSIDSLAVRVKKNTERIEVLEDTISSIIERLNTLSDSIKVLDERVDSLMDAEKKRITSLLVQGTINPAFGSFSLPLGIRSNILMGYYGQFDTDIEFPTQSTAHMVNPATALTARDFELIGSGVKQTLAADALAYDTIQAGKLLFTVNPNEVALDSTYKFTFVNSAGDTCAAQLGDIQASTEKLTFGFSTKADAVSSPNGFFEAPVYIMPEDAASMTPNIDKDALKGIAKDILSWRDGIDLGTFAPAIMKAFDGVLDANALNVTWSDSLGEHNVKSQYDLAVAAVRPLSYNTLADFSISRSLPTLPDLSSISLNIDTLEFTPMSFTINDIPVFSNLASVSINDNDVEVVIEMPVGSGTYYYGHASNSFADITASIDAAVDENIDSVRVTMNRFIGEIRDQVGDVTSEINGVFSDVNDMIRGIQSSANSQINNYISKANTYINKVNTWINRINGKLTSLSPDVLLQPTVLYTGADNNLHQMSASSAIPSKFTGYSSGTGIVLYLTSYTAELLAPAYKKHVAVTNVISLADGTNAQDGDSTCESILSATNTGDLNQVLDGDQVEVAFTPSAAGYIYEIAFSAIDYNGWISTRKFYVTVQ